MPVELLGAMRSYGCWGGYGHILCLLGGYVYVCFLGSSAMAVLLSSLCIFSAIFLVLVGGRTVLLSLTCMADHQALDKIFGATNASFQG